MHGCSPSLRAPRPHGRPISDSGAPKWRGAARVAATETSGSYGWTRPANERLRGQVSWLTGLRFSPPSRRVASLVALGEKLAVYSCGHSHGLLGKAPKFRVPFSRPARFQQKWLPVLCPKMRQIIDGPLLDGKPAPTFPKSGLRTTLARAPVEQWD